MRIGSGFGGGRLSRRLSVGQGTPDRVRSRPVPAGPWVDVPPAASFPALPGRPGDAGGHPAVVAACVLSACFGGSVAAMARAVDRPASPAGSRSPARSRSTRTPAAPRYRRRVARRTRRSGLLRRFVVVRALIEFFQERVRFPHDPEPCGSWSDPSAASRSAGAASPNRPAFTLPPQNRAFLSATPHPNHYR